jgi:glucose-1-phosphate thymidylyltransferase
MMFSREPATKAVVLAAGMGTRMRAADEAAALTPEQAAAADVGLKSMIPIDRPFLDYVFNALADAGFTDVCLVVPREHDVIRDYYTRRLTLSRLHLSFAVQQHPAGTADAVLCAAAFIGDDAFVVLNADNYYPPDVLRALRNQPAPALPAFDRATLVQDSNIPPERIARYALLDVRDGLLRRIVEKPDAATVAAFGPSAAVSMNCWLLTPAIFDACRRVPPSVRGELELPLAIQWALDHMQMRISVLPATAAVLDLSHRGDVAAVAARLRGTRVEL